MKKSLQKYLLFAVIIFCKTISAQTDTADLSITQIITDDTIWVDSVFSVTINVKNNNGNIIDLTAGISIIINSPTLDGNPDTLLLNVPDSGDTLAPGDSVNIVFNPGYSYDTELGDTQLCISTNFIVDTNISNNTYCMNVVIQKKGVIINGYDLTVTDLISPNISIQAAGVNTQTGMVDPDYPGEPVNFVFTIKNIGNETFNVVVDTLFLRLQISNNPLSVQIANGQIADISKVEYTFYGSGSTWSISNEILLPNDSITFIWDEYPQGLVTNSGIRYVDKLVGTFEFCATVTNINDVDTTNNTKCNMVMVTASGYTQPPVGFSELVLKNSFGGFAWQEDEHTIFYTIYSNENTTAQYRLVDISGRVVRYEAITLVSGINNNQLNIAHLKNGIYLMDVTNKKGEHFSHKLMIK